MKDEIMSKAEVSAFTSIFLGLAGYSIFMFYLLAALLHKPICKGFFSDIIFK
ncbi:hypothetical protein [Acinetobacter baumannii]|uniref:hypothetical protein n=1 Tax=Acinetobacter baumannii TaxID=470 RepID=UPI0022366032|nr:hypothetical protein [Acinetobacter baumannii]UZG64129.1 hypothetical protein OMP06_03635 [Acinetobacter baumannii]